MSIVVVERRFDEPIDFDDFQEREVEECLRRHRVRAGYSLLARDRLRMVCVYDAPDADSVRATQDENGLPYERIWSARSLPLPPAPRDERYVTVAVQRELKNPMTLEQVAINASDPDGCAARHRSTLLSSMLSFDGRRMLCQYLAPDAESVRAANTQAGLAFTRAWVAAVHGCPGFADKRP